MRPATSGAGESAPWPKEVRRACESARAIGLDPVVTGTPGGSWLVAVEGEHVRATAAFEHRAGRTKQVCGELTVDGEPHPLAESWEHLREIWDRHELGVTAPAGLMEVTDPGRVPPPDIVRTTAGRIESRAPGVPVRTGVSGEHWVIAADGQDGDGLRLVFTRYGRSWGLDEDRPVQVVVGGEDRSEEAEGDIGKAVALAFGGSRPPDAAVPAASPRRQPAARSNGVETRRMVVIRELPGCAAYEARARYHPA